MNCHMNPLEFPRHSVGVSLEQLHGSIRARNGEVTRPWVAVVTDDASGCLLDAEVYETSPTIEDIETLSIQVAAKHGYPQPVVRTDTFLPYRSDEDEKLTRIKSWSQADRDYYLTKEQQLLDMGTSESQAEEIAFYETERLRKNGGVPR